MGRVRRAVAMSADASQTGWGRALELLRLASRRLWAAWVRNSTEEWIVVGKASLHSSRASAQPVGCLCFVLSGRLDGSERMGLWMEARTGSVSFGGAGGT